MSTEAPAVTARRDQLAALATAARDAADALHAALFDLNAALHPTEQADDMLNSAIGFGHSGSMREVEAAQRLIEDIGFDIVQAARIGSRAAHVARIANNTF